VLAGITGLTVTSLAATFGDSYAVTSTGQVLSWGDNTFGELGTKLSLTDVTTPIFVALPSGVTVSSATGGAFHVLARTTTGHVLAWGFNGHGQLGDGTSNDEFQPKQIPLPGGATVKALSAGNFHSLALTTTGKVFAWGEGTEGELGDNLLADIFSAVKVHLPTTFAVTGIAAGPGADHSLAIGHKV
jgi:alpha-tubulin suppressor-like RCC1 family protein